MRKKSLSNSTSQPVNNRVVEIVLFLCLLVSYAYFLPHWADPNQNSRLDMVVAVVDDHTFQIDRYVANTVDYAMVGNHYYSDKAPGTAFLGIPLYAGLKVVLDTPIMNSVMQRLSHNQAFQDTLRENGSGVLLQKVRFAIAQVVLTFFIVALPSALLGLLLFRLLGKFTPRLGLRLTVVGGYALLTPAFAYSWAFYSHQLVAVLLFAAFYLVFMAQKPLTATRLLGVGLLLGLSVVTEYPTVLIAGILFVYTLYKLYRQHNLMGIAWVILGGVLFAIPWMVYNKTVFGGWLTLGYSDSTLWEKQHHTGFMSLTYPTWQALWGITFGVFRGLFVLSPWLLMAVPGFILWWRSRQYRSEFWAALASVISFFIFNASSIMWWGGFSIGPRYLLPMFPFMALSTIFVFRAWGSNPVFKLLAGLLFAWSFVANWGLTLAEQAFPPDTLSNPYLQFALPNWETGNIARSLGTMLGLPHWWSLAPLALLLALLVLAGWLSSRPSRTASSYNPSSASY